MKNMFSFYGNRIQAKAFTALLERYGLNSRKLEEFSELDKILFQNIKKASKYV